MPLIENNLFINNLALYDVHRTIFVYST